MALSAESDLDFDPNTILQTQDYLSQDYESLRALAEVMFLIRKLLIKPLPWAKPCVSIPKD